MNDRANTRLINVSVALITVAALVGIIVLTLADKAVPDAIPGVLLLGLGALTAHSSTRPTSSGDSSVSATLEQVAEPVRISPGGPEATDTGAAVTIGKP